MAKDSPSQSADKYILRLPEGMRDRIAEEARTNRRSMNAEIIDRLQSSFINEPLPDHVNEAQEFANVVITNKWTNLRARLTAAQYAGLLNALFRSVEDGSDIPEEIRAHLERARNRAAHVIEDGVEAALEYEFMLNEVIRLSPESDTARHLQVALEQVKPAISLIRAIDSMSADEATVSSPLRKRQLAESKDK